MDEKESKVPIYIAILVAVILIAAGGFYVLGGPSKLLKVKPAETPVATPEPTLKETQVKTPSETPAAAVAPARVETIKCDLCHKDAQNLNPHINGGKFCVNCHGSQVHSIHIGPGTVSLACDSCHESNVRPNIPQVQKGEGPGHYSVCENCHAAPPDSLKPSNGDLIIIHLSRGKSCTNCHGTDIGAIHAAVLANASMR
jgi:hypothetical protein